MRTIGMIALGLALLAGAALAQTDPSKPMSASDYFRSGDASSSASSSTSSTAGMVLYTSCKAFKDQGGIRPSMSRDDVADAARAAGCTDAEINSLTALWDVMPHS